MFETLKELWNNKGVLQAAVYILAFSMIYSFIDNVTESKEEREDRMVRYQIIYEQGYGAGYLDATEDAIYDDEAPRWVTETW